MINRRSVLLGIGAALAAPAIVRAESLMRVVVPRPALTPQQVRNTVEELLRIDAAIQFERLEISQALSDAIVFGLGVIQFPHQGKETVVYGAPLPVWTDGARSVILRPVAAPGRASHLPHRSDRA